MARTVETPHASLRGCSVRASALARSLTPRSLTRAPFRRTCRPCGGWRPPSPPPSVLRSPLVGLSLNELATIRLTSRHGHLWSALQRWRETEARDSGGAGSKVDRFLKRHARWRRMARETSLSQRLEAVLDETNYRDWLLAQPRGEQRLANVRHLLGSSPLFNPKSETSFLSDSSRHAGDNSPSSR